MLPHRSTFAQPLLATAALGAVALLVSSCGLRVSSSLRETGIRGANGNGTSAAVPAGSGPGGADTSTTGTAAGPATSTGGPAGAGSTGTSVQTGASTTTGPGVAASAPPGGNGGATAVGVTASSITLGAVTTLSGPVPGLFSGDVYGAQAYFAYVNSQGGIFGRQLRLEVADDQLDCGQNRTQHLAQAGHVFSWVSSLSLYDNCGAPVLQQHKDMSEVAVTFSTQAGGLKNSFSINPLVPGYRLGSLQYYKQKFPGAVVHAASLVGNIGSAVEIFKGIRAASESVGYHWDYVRNYSPGETDFTADIIQMRNDGVQMLYFVSADSHTIAKVLNAAKQQRWSPQLIAVGAGDAAYDPSFIPEAGAASEGVYADQPHAAFFNPSDGRIPGVGLYQQWMSKTGATKHEDLYSAWGWGSAVLAVQALKAAGPKLTRQAFLTALGNVHHFDGNGMFAASDPAGKKPSTCYVVLKVVHGAWQRTDTPTTSFRCGSYYYYKP
ncbi:MAG: ABC-type branched-chain amino acid transport system periplasmic component-like protein [Frankiales bacterium]|nr:ABC-type branched-chain amino acid transport system periplasmic component-like protein [Frankiales bacterium]